jgi:hypothetical protein
MTKFRFQTGAGIFPLPHCFPTLALRLVYPAVSLRIKLPEREADYSHSSSVKIKNVITLHPFAPLSSYSLIEGSEVLTAMVMKSFIFCDIAPCSLLKIS